MKLREKIESRPSETAGLVTSSFKFVFDVLVIFAIALLFFFIFLGFLGVMSVYGAQQNFLFIAWMFTSVLAVFLVASLLGVMAIQIRNNDLLNDIRKNTEEANLHMKEFVRMANEA